MSAQAEKTVETRFFPNFIVHCCEYIWLNWMCSYDLHTSILCQKKKFWKTNPSDSLKTPRYVYVQVKMQYKIHGY